MSYPILIVVSCGLYLRTPATGYLFTISSYLFTTIATVSLKFPSYIVNYLSLTKTNLAE